MLLPTLGEMHLFGFPLRWELGTGQGKDGKIPRKLQFGNCYFLGRCELFREKQINNY